MNDMARRMMMNRDYRRGRDYGGGDYRGRDYGEGEYRGSMEYRGDYGMGEYNTPVPGPDGRRGVKGTGRYGIGGSRYYGRDRAMDRGMEDYEGGGMYYDRRGGRDYNMDYGPPEEMKLNKQDMLEWKRKIKNADGSTGEHFDAKQIMDAASKIGIHYENYDEKELAMVANVLFSDYCDALRAYIPQDKEAIIYTKMAKAFLEDEDGPEGSEKLALYYYCIVDAEE